MTRARAASGCLGKRIGVAHARAGWSRQHLEQPAAWVQQQLQTALAECLGQPVDWLRCTVHRWRYAQTLVQKLAPADMCWWDATLGLGVCGDFFSGSGVEGAWLSAQSLSLALSSALTSTATQLAAAAPCAIAVHEGPHDAARRLVT
jgi:renalase